MAKPISGEHIQSHRLGYILKQAQQAMRDWMDQRLKRIGLTAPQYNVLAAVEYDPGISNAKLARGAFVTAQTMVGIVVNLERAGLLRRDAHPVHGRIRSCELTAAGRKVVREAHSLMRGLDERMISSFDLNESDMLRKLLLRCTENLRASGQVD